MPSLDPHSHLTRASSTTSVCTQSSETSKRREAELDQIRTSLAKRRKEENKMVARQLEESLAHIKNATKTLLSEVGNLLEANEMVEFEYEKALQSQREEELRLASMEPDVNGATDQYGNPQQLLSMMSTMSNSTTRP